jgi:hypothetical protein
MTLDLVAVVREAAARWRQDRALLLPIAGLLLFVPQWAVLLFVPEAPQVVADPSDPAAMMAWAEAVQRWMQVNGPLYLGAFVFAQWGQLALVALYVGAGKGAGERPTVGGALARSGRLLIRYVLAELLVSMPLGAGVLAGSAAPPILLVVVPAVIYVLGRTVLVGPALLVHQPLGAVRAVATSWRWTRGNSSPLALLAGALVIGAPVLVGLVRTGGDAMQAAHLANPVVLAALNALAAAIAAGAMLALSMCVGVLYRRLAR